MADSNINIQVEADVSSATTALGTLGDRLNKLGGKMTSFGKTMTLAVSAPLIAVGVASVKLASDLQETLSKTDVVFGKSSESMKKWAKTALKQFGMSESSALDMASLFGDMGQGMDVPKDKMEEMSKGLTGLASDVSSFKNVSLERAKEALTGIFTGEGEALKSLGVVMQDSTLNEFAQAKGMKKKFTDMSQGEKVMLRYAYVNEKLANAQGDFLETQGSTANQVRIFNASLEQLGATFGTKILPVITPVIKKLNELAKQFGAMPASTQKLILGIGAVAIVIPFLIIGVGMLISAIGAIMTAVAGAGGVFGLLFSPIVLVTLAIAGLVAGFVLMYRSNEQFRTKVQEVWGFIKVFISDAVTSIKTIISVVLTVIKELWAKHGDQIIALVNTAFSFVVAIIKTVLGIIGGVIKVFAGILTGDWDKIWSGVKQILYFAWEGIKNIISTGLALLKGIFTTGLDIIVSVIKSIFGGVVNLFKEPLQKAGEVIQNELAYIKGLFAKFKLPSIKGNVNINTTTSGDGSGSRGSTKWFAKGGVFNEASKIGVGEDGAEAVLPLTNNKTMAMLGAKISEFLPDNIGGGAGAVINNVFNVNATIREEADVDRLGEKLYKLQQRESRRLGRSGV